MASYGCATVARSLECEQPQEQGGSAYPHLVMGGIAELLR
jgi:hypothetical protein